MKAIKNEKERDTDEQQRYKRKFEANHQREKLAIQKVQPRNIEGYNTANWILMDYSDILVHIFDTESRGFYDLEHMWRDGKSVAL